MFLRLAFCFILLLSFTAQAADLDVRVFDRTGKTPLQWAGICLGTHANVKRFGVLESNSKGYVTFRINQRFLGNSLHHSSPSLD
jgi:hypothetical protein